MIGESIGHYRITGKLGQGGMGEVYRATDSKLGREVAIKVLPAAFAGDPDRMARFQREAHVLASLNHPNIAAIYGIEERAIVMELVEGETLKGPLPLDTALNYAAQIADALEAAHEKGITHRDLKPANVKITPQGVVKVLDFGLAKIAEPASAPGNPISSPTLTMRATEAGMIMGTAAYMAPEQARGQPVDKRADIWAFGVVLWEMLTGKRMFSGGTISDVLAGVLKNEPDLEAVPAQVRRLLARCLQKDSRKRLRDIGDWRGFLEEARQSKTSGKLPWMVAACLGIVAAIALWAPWRKQADRPLVQLDLDVGDAVSQPAISPDGMRLAFIIKNQLAVRRLDQANSTPLGGTEGASFPFFSPDGQWVAFFAGGKLQKIAVDGGAVVALCDAPSGRGGAWGEDGNIVAALGSREGLSRVPASGGAPRPLTDVGGAVHTTSHRWPQVLPRGKGVLFTATTAGGLVQVLPPGGGQAKTLVEEASSGRYLEPGYLLYHRRGTIFARQIDLQRMELKESAAPLVSGVAFDNLHGAAFDLSRFGTLVYRRGTAGTSFTVSFLHSGGNTVPVLPKPGDYSTLRLAPDGKRLALSVAHERQRSLWVYDLTGDAMRRLTFDAAYQDFPLWTPDGEFVVFQSNGALAWVRSDGSGDVRRLPATSRNAAATSFSPDGKWIVFHQDDPRTSWDLWVAPVTRAKGAMQLGEPRSLLRQDGPQLGPAVSRDGRWLAYASNESGRFEVYVIPFSPGGPPRSGKWLVSHQGGMWPAWSRGGNELFYQDLNRRVVTAAYAARGDSFVSEKPRIWSERRLAEAGQLSAFDLAPDGKRVVALFDADESKPETHLRVMLNVGDELRRRMGAK